MPTFVYLHRSFRWMNHDELILKTTNSLRIKLNWIYYLSRKQHWDNLQSSTFADVHLKLLDFDLYFELNTVSISKLSIVRTDIHLKCFNSILWWVFRHHLKQSYANQMNIELDLQRIDDHVRSYVHSKQSDLMNELSFAWSFSNENTWTKMWRLMLSWFDIRCLINLWNTPDVNIEIIW